MTVAGPRGLRVLQVGPLYVDHLRRWCEHARTLGCTVCAAGHARPGRPPIDLHDVAEQVEVAPPELQPSDVPQRVAWLRGVISRTTPDIVQAHWLPTWGCCAVDCGHPTVVATPWGSDVYRGSPAAHTRADRALRGAHAVLARSPHMLRELLDRGAPPERTHRVDLGVDLQRFRPACAAERERLRDELGLPCGPVILSFRAGTALYNLDVVVDAFRLLRTRAPDATLVLAHGSAPLSQALRTRLDALHEADRVRVVGNIPHADMPLYLRSATVGVSIPGSDGSPNSVWEALACGLPLVLSDLPQIAERVGTSGAATLVEPRADVVASALHEVIALPPRRTLMSDAARTWSLVSSDERDQVAGLGAVYEALTRTRADQAGDGADSPSGTAPSAR